jgi:hypothetical protein
MRKRVEVVLSAVVVIGALMVLCAVSASAAVPQLINYQGKLTTPSGAPVSDGVYTFALKIYNDSVAGAALWSETKAVQVTGGLFTTRLGSDVALPDTLFSSGAPRFLGMKINLDPDMPRVRLLSVPAAYQSLRSDSSGYAANAKLLDGLDGSAFAPAAHSHIVTTAEIQNGTIVFEDVGQNGASNGQVMKWNGAAWVAANDSMGPSGGPFLPLAGGTMTGAISNTSDPPITMGKGNFGTGNLNPGGQATVAGSNNRARGDYSTVGGGGGPLPDDSNSALGTYSTVSGGRRNCAIGMSATVGGGEFNSAAHLFSTVAGGRFNSATLDRATVAGGTDNTASGTAAAVTGGAGNTASGQWAYVGGGQSNAASDTISTVSGGRGNIASGRGATVGGGEGNAATGVFSTVVGSQNNTASGSNSTACGGGNTASDAGATVSGGFTSVASGYAATVAGGHTNNASGWFSTVGGGAYNTAGGNYSFAAGRNAKALTHGSFVWADQTGASLTSGVDDQFLVRASGGTKIFSDPAAALGVELAAGGGSWASISDRNLKEGVAPVDGAALLAKVAALPIATWKYKAQDPSIRHIGPMAQDFSAAFGVGEDSLHISTVDADGVALAAIQELARRLDQKTVEVQDLRAMIETLQRQVEAQSGNPR